MFTVNTSMLLVYIGILLIRLASRSGWAAANDLDGFTSGHTAPLVLCLFRLVTVYSTPFRGTLVLCLRTVVVIV
jgi:hypothetical protein